VSEEGFLSRWSRRKRAAEAGREVAEAPPADGPVLPPANPVSVQPPPAFVPPAAGRVAPPEGASASPVPPDGATATRTEPPGDPPFDIASLPAIESLTAATDIRAFLRKEVPEALKRAALRKAWTLDPAIRDFVGPADYAWDYNAPDGVPGGSLDLVGDVREMLAQVFGPDTPADDGTMPPGDDSVAATAERPPAPDMPAPVEPEVAAAPSPTATEAVAEPTPDLPVAAAVRRHGSAVPS
jgi:hypothetical protein